MVLQNPRLILFSVLFLPVLLHTMDRKRNKGKGKSTNTAPKRSLSEQNLRLSRTSSHLSSSGSSESPQSPITPPAERLDSIQAHIAIQANTAASPSSPKKSGEPLGSQVSPREKNQVTPLFPALIEENAQTRYRMLRQHLQTALTLQSLTLQESQPSHPTAAEMPAHAVFPGTRVDN